MASHSDRQLAWNVVQNLPWLTLVLLLGQCLAFALLNLSDGRATVFALQADSDALLRNFAFDVSQPLRNFGLNFLSSFFVHSNADHFVSNLSFAGLVLFFAERMLGARVVLLLLALGHGVSLAGAAVAHSFLSQVALAAGMSGGLATLATVLAVEKWKGLGLGLTALFCISYGLMSPATLLVHLFPVGLGVYLALAGRRWFNKKISGKSANAP